MTADIIDTNLANSTENRFSWKRVLEFAGIYSYLIKRQLLVYGAISLLITILTLIPFNGFIQTGFYTIFTSILDLIYCFSPLILCKFGDFRPLVYMTPAKPSEKTAFYVIYFLIILPLTVFLLPYIGWSVIYRFPETASPEFAELISIYMSANKLGIFSSQTQMAATVMTCFYVVLSSHNNRLAKGIVSVICIFSVLGIFGAITGILIERQTGFGAALMLSHDLEAYSSQMEENILDFISDMQGPLTVLFTVLAVYTILMIWLTYHRLRHPKI